MTEERSHGNEDYPGADDEGSDAEVPPIIERDLLRRLNEFQNLQRHIAGIDFSALEAAQRALATVDLSHIAAMQEAAARNIALSFDFSAIEAAGKAALLNIAGIAATASAQQWAQTIASAADFSALKRANDALVSSAALRDLIGAQKSWADVLAVQVDFGTLSNVLARAAETAGDLSRWRARWIPSNLWEITNLDAVAKVALDEGIPLSWVPRGAIVEALVAAPDAEARARLLEAQFDEILDDCDAAMAGADHEWAVQIRGAVAALRAGFDAPAQSHGANIIDSIILRLMRREDATKRAELEFDDVPLQLAAESLTLRPLFRAFAVWWPKSGDAPPDHFARHPTAHAVGYAGLFSRGRALVAIMLATSLAVQFSDELRPDSESTPAGGPA